MAKYLTLFVVVILLSVAHGAPHRQRYRRHHRYLSQVQLAHEPMPLRPMEWVNPCKIQAPQVSHLNTTQTGEPPYPPPKNKTPFMPLRNFLALKIQSLNHSDMTAIDTNDISTWFTQNGTYKFLRQIESNKTQLRHWHEDTQVYIGAFQKLLKKHQNFDKRQNLGNATSIELKMLMDLAKSLLCEIESAINVTYSPMPRVFTRHRMDHTLTFRSDIRANGTNEVDDLDIKFAKVRFHEYLHSLNRILQRPRKKRIPPLCKDRTKTKRRKLCGKRDVDGKSANCSSSETVNTEIIHKNPEDGPHHRHHHRNGHNRNCGHLVGARFNQIPDENQNRLQHQQRRQRKHNGHRRPRLDADGNPIRNHRKQLRQQKLQLEGGKQTNTDTIGS